MPRPGPWNRNIEYHRLVVDAVPAGARRALDVGCGEGHLTRALAEHVPDVVGIDRHGPTLARAAAHADGRTSFVLGDVLDHPFPPASFDLVASIATLHHLDAVAGLRRMAALVRPGGSLVVVGLPRSRLPHDIPWHAASAVLTRLHALTKRYVEVEAPMVWPPPQTYAEMRRIVHRELPGARIRRLVLVRYLVRWTRPASAPPDHQDA